MKNERVRIDPVTGWNDLMVQQVVRSIKLAHGFNPNCWSLHQVKGSPTTAKLTVGKANVLRWDRNLNHLLIDAATLTEAQGSVFSHMEAEEFPKARDLGQPRVLHVPDDRVADILDMFRKITRMRFGDLPRDRKVAASAVAYTRSSSEKISNASLVTRSPSQNIG